MVIELGGFAVDFRVSDPAFAKRLDRRYALFLSRARPALTVEVSARPAPTARIPRPFEPKVEDDGARLRFSRGDAEGTFDYASGRGTLSVWPNPWSFDAAARILYSRLLARRRAFFVHAAAVSDGKRTVLFPGPSGAGKTTLARTCRSLGPLGDELVLVRRDGRGFTAASTPFWGNGRTAERTGSGRVDALAFLERRPEPAVRRLERGEALRRASKCLVWFGGATKELAGVWNELAALAGSAPSAALSFRKSESPWPELVRLLDEDR